MRLLTRIIPFLFEDPQWRMMFWATTNMASTSAPSAGGGAGGAGSPSLALGQMLLNAVTDLLFCPDFTVKGKKKKGQPVWGQVGRAFVCVLVVAGVVLPCVEGMHHGLLLWPTGETGRSLSCGQL